MRYLKILFLAVVVVFLSSDTLLADTGTSAEEEFDSYFEQQEETFEERRSKDYDDLMHYELMSHADENWWDVASKTGNNILVGVRDLAWSTYTVVADVISTVVYHMFNVDLLEMLMPNLNSFTSSTAGQIINNLLVFGMAFVGVTITIRGFVKQDWGAFFKILLLTLVSLTLLFSIQSEKFNYIGLVNGISKDIENTLIATPPSLLTGQEVNYGTQDTAINMENRIYNALLLQPYLDLQYGDTSVSRINGEREEDYKVYDYLDASPFNEEGQETRSTIAEYEFEDMNNNNVNSANASTQIGKIFMYFISLLVQGFIYIVLAAIRYMLQIGMIIALVMLPFVLFLSLISSFEKIIIGYTRKVFQLILYKAILVFYMIFVMAIMQITYTIQNYGMIQAIVFQVVLAISAIMLYFYRNSALDTISDSSSINASEASGQGFGRSMSNMGHRMKSTATRQAGFKDHNAKDFKESNQRQGATAFANKGETEQSQSNFRKNTNQTDNQDMNTQQNKRDNVTSFSDYQNKKQQQDEQMNKQEDTLKNNQTENSQRQSAVQSDVRETENNQRQSDMKESGNINEETTDINRNNNNAQHQQLNTNQSENRESATSSYRSEQTAKDNQINTSENKDTANTEQYSRSNISHNAQNTSSARNVGSNQFINDKPQSQNNSKPSQNRTATDSNSDTKNNQANKINTPSSDKAKSNRNRKLSAVRNSKNFESKEGRIDNRKPTQLNKKSAVNRTDTPSRQSNLKGMDKSNSPQRNAKVLNRKNTPQSNSVGQTPNRAKHTQQGRQNRNVKGRANDSINEMNNRIKPVKQSKRPTPPKQEENHQKVDVNKHVSNKSQRQKTFDTFKNKRKE
ncbi:CD3337/EF1877 family mobilome membrane protein [Salinicoccus jeotgali]|uniref:CD3337/EF1877 family mobilome membrane protein n=1 Tax=Salinicoccus jeotgali TaxID=381634 RepID=UPI003CD0BB1D